MMSMLTCMILYLALKISQISNPAKMITILTFFTLTLFLAMAIKTGSSWFPTLYSMIFLGGVILMFTVISSSIPNQPSKNLKLSKMLFIIMAIMILITEAPKMGSANTQVTSDMKFNINEKSMMILISLILIAYFGASMKVISTKETPMRKLS